MGLTVRYATLVAAGDPPRVNVAKKKRAAAILLRPAVSTRGTHVQPFEVEISLHAPALGSRVFRPSVPGTRLERGKRVSAKLVNAGERILGGYLPDHLALSTRPAKLERQLQVRRFYKQLSRKRRKGLGEATTIFPPDNRYAFADTSFPWSTCGRVETAGGQGSGVLIGPRHLLTVSHLMVWNADNSSGWVKFTPSYFDGNQPFGEAWAIHWYAFKKVVGPSLSYTEEQYDYVVLALDWRIGDVCGWMGSRTFQWYWTGAYWSHIGYPGDLAGGQRPSFQSGISLTVSALLGNNHEALWNKADVWPGQSGGPYFGWWDGEEWPRVVGVQSAQYPSMNSGSGGTDMVDLILTARNDFP